MWLTALGLYYLSALVTYLVTSSILWALYRLGKHEYLLPTSFMLYTLLLTTSQYLASKIGAIGPVMFPMGLITYSASVAVLDYITLRFGRGYGYTVVRIAVAAQLLIAVLNYLIIEFPPAPVWGLQRAFSEVMSVNARIVVASVIAFTASQTYDVYLVSRLRGGVLRRVGYSDPISMLIDSLVFVPTAFYGVIPSNELILIALYQALGKVMLTPLTMAAVWLNRHALRYGLVSQGQRQL